METVKSSTSATLLYVERPILNFVRYVELGRVSEVVEICRRHNLRVNIPPPNRRLQPPGRSRHEPDY